MYRSSLRLSFRIMAGVLLSLTYGLGVQAQQATAERPNIVFILADDLGCKDLGCYGTDYYRTPNLDRLASQGMAFFDAYANGANCAPTRAALMSGQYAPRTGVYTVNNSDRGPAARRRVIPTRNNTTLSPDVVTLAEVLRDAGYATGHVGKWHLGEGEQSGPQGQGFDVNVAGWHRGHPRSYFSPYQNPELSDGPEGEYLTDRLTTEAIAFMEQDRDAPFFLYLPYYTVHTPIQPHPEWLSRIEQRQPGELHTNARYGAMVDAMDFQIGRVLGALDRLGIADNTLVVFMSDNGGKSPETDMAPWRGSKGMFYEGGIRVPLIVRWPGMVSPGSTCNQPVITLDFYPTLAAIVGAMLPADQPIDGQDLSALLADGGAELGREALYWHFPAYLNGYRGMVGEGPADGWRATPCSVIRAGDWKLIEYLEDGRLELFNLADDPGEQKNLAQENTGKAQDLLEMLGDWRDSVQAPIPTEPNPAYRAGGER